MEQEKVLLNVEETAAYLNLGMTKTRELMKENEKIFVVKIGNRNYAHKLLLDKWLFAQCNARSIGTFKRMLRFCIRKPID